MRKPTTHRQWIAFLKAYTVKEASLALQQVADPLLATMQAHEQTIANALAARDSGRDMREINVEVKNTAVSCLLNLLQIDLIQKKWKQQQIEVNFDPGIRQFR